MLLRLPLEIFLNISSLLDFKDKLNLKTTCAKLNEHITNAILYEKMSPKLFDLKRCNSIELRKENYKIATNNYFQKLIDNKFDGSVVKVLHINIDALYDHTVSQLSDLFPNIKRITTRILYTFKYSFDKHMKPTHDYQTVPFVKWRDTIEKIDLRQDWKEFIIDLMNYEYPRLTELCIIDASFVFDACRKYNKLTFFNNAPLLTSLTLLDAKIDLDILEAIHNGFPLLKLLSLSGITIDINKTTALPSFIAPANALTCFEFCYSSGFNTNVVQTYMLKKYPKLQKLGYNIDLCEDYNIETRFFSKLPKSIKTLSLRMVNAQAAVTDLVESGVNMTILDLQGIYVNSLAASEISEQSMPMEAAILQDIKKFTALRTLKISVNLPPQIFTSDFISPNVTKLYISLYAPITFLESILSVFPSLGELYLVRENKCLSPPRYEIRGRDDETEEIQPIRTYPKLEILHIRYGLTHPGFFLFVKTALPNLSDLKVRIDLSKFDYSRTYKVDLSGYSLNNCNLSFNTVYIDYTVTMQNVSRCILSSQFLNAEFKNSRIYSSTKKAHQVEITVDHVKNFKVRYASIVNIGGNILVNGKI